MRETKKRIAAMIARYVAEAEERLARAGVMTATKKRAQIVRMAVKRIETCESLVEDLPELILRRAATGRKVERVRAKAERLC